MLEAGNGVEAIEVLEKRGGDVDLVVSDVVMPEMDGPTLLKELRRRDPDVKIIFVSGYAEEAFAKNLPDGKARQYEFLAKPFTLKQLVAAVKQTMAALTQRIALHISGQRQHQHDDQQHADDAGRAVAPAAAVAPARERADQHQDQKNDQNRSEHAPLLGSRG